MKIDCIDYKDISFLPKLMSDYLFNNDNLQPYFSNEPKVKGFENAIKSKSFLPEKRKILVDVLRKNYSQISNATQQLEKIKLLESENTFTVTTGHQLCLFTGPLYFIYKIFSVVKLSEELKIKFPEYNFVPIYWMASEDHDFEEINHFFLHNNRYGCSADILGAVGGVTPDVTELLSAFKNELGRGKLGQELYNLFEKSYQNSTLTEATFNLVHSLLGEYGIVILNPDNKKLKQVFRPFVKQELENKTSYKAVGISSKQLQTLGYKTQVNPREINLFYLKSNPADRVRIEKIETGYQLSDNSQTFTNSELLEELNTYPERFSPNVILRPLYQEIVLPNLSYTGGAGELSYWFQLKEMFGSFNVDFPILLLRNSAIVLSSNNRKRLDKLELKMQDLFLEINELENLILKKHSNKKTSLELGKEELSNLFSKIKIVAQEVNPSLDVTVDATRSKSIKLIEKLEKKLVRHEKLNQRTVLDQLYMVLNEVFPNGTFQERRTNFSEYYLESGNDFFKQAYQKFDPFEMQINVLEA